MFDLQGECTESAILSLAYLSSHEILLHNLRFNLESVKRMVEDDRDCSEILIQLSAVKSAINNCGNEILKEHISHCIVHAVEDGDDKAIVELNEAIDKFMKNS